MKKVVFTEEAEQDLREAVSWYESQKKGIGKNLANEVIEKVQKLSLKPDSYSADHTGLRKTSLKSFPCIIYFLVTHLTPAAAGGAFLAGTPAGGLRADRPRQKDG